jgi:hypothetical protein
VDTTTLHEIVKTASDLRLPPNKQKEHSYVHCSRGVVDLCLPCASLRTGIGPKAFTLRNRAPINGFSRGRYVERHHHRAVLSA